jgi:hypothetical protein
MEVKTACDSTQQYAALYNSSLGPQNGNLHAPSLSESLENGKARVRRQRLDFVIGKGLMKFQYLQSRFAG